MVSGFVVLFVGFSKWFNSNKKSVVLKAIVYIIKVVIKEMDKYIEENRGYGVLFVVKIWTS